MKAEIVEIILLPVAVVVGLAAYAVKRTYSKWNNDWLTWPTSGQTFPAWVQSQTPECVAHVSGLRRIPDIAWMQQRKTPERNAGT